MITVSSLLDHHWHERYKRISKLNIRSSIYDVTNQCNLTCQGCWITIDNKSQGMEPDTLNNIINSSKKKGSYFFGLLGGEPLMYPHIIEVIEKHSDCYFQLFITKPF